MIYGVLSILLYYRPTLVTQQHVVCGRSAALCSGVAVWYSVHIVPWPGTIALVSSHLYGFTVDIDALLKVKLPWYRLND